MRLVALLLLPLSAACSADRLTTTDQDPDAAHRSVQVTGPLTLEVRDFPTQGGILWALPSVTPGAGSIAVSSTQYGSLCRFAVSGNVATDGNKIALHVSFAERLTLCTAEIRALSYTATFAETAGTYDVTVIHDYGNRSDTLVKRTVVVR